MEWIVLDLVLFGMGVTFEEVVLIPSVLCNVPIYAVVLEVFDVFLARLYPAFQAARAVFEKAEEVHLAGTGVALTLEVHDMVVPSVNEVLRILVDSAEK